MICDSHAHLNHSDAFDADRGEVLRRAQDAGVTLVLNVATAPADLLPTVEVARAHPEVFAAVGIHPHEASSLSDETLSEVERLAADPRVLAWGEIGLDYHYLHAPRVTQREAFARQLDAAARLDLPVSVHTRKADSDTIELLRSHAGPRRGVIHCFTGDRSLATACLDLGFCLSFSGIVTFRNAEALRAVAASVPADRLLVETDSPFLAPEPRRGGRNEPARVLDVIRALAEPLGMAATELAALTTRNFLRLFRPPGLL